MWKSVTNIKREPEPAKFFAVVDPDSVKPSIDEITSLSLSASPGLYGNVVQTVGTREEAERLKGAKQRVMQVRSDLKPGHRVSASDTVAEICRGLPNRGDFIHRISDASF